MLKYNSFGLQAKQTIKRIHRPVPLNPIQPPKRQLLLVARAAGLGSRSLQTTKRHNYNNIQLDSYPGANTYHFLKVCEKTTFPNADIYFPILNYSSHLTTTQKNNLKMINITMATHFPFLTEIPHNTFRTEKDNIHGTPATAKAIFTNCPPTSALPGCLVPWGGNSQQFPPPESSFLFLSGHNSMTRGTGAPSQPPDPHTYKTTTVTTTGILEGEGSEAEEEEDYVSPTPIQPHQTPPKPQRARRAPWGKLEHHTTATGNPCVAQGDDILLDLSLDELETLLEEDQLGTPHTGRLLPMDTPLAPHTIRRMETAVQSQINLGPRRQDHTPPTPETPTRKPTKHLNTYNKMQNWGLSVGKKWLIMGDSNVARVPPFTAADLQIDSYPGATFRHAEAILTRATSSVTVETVIVSFGLNNSSQNVKQIRSNNYKQLSKQENSDFHKQRSGCHKLTTPGLYH
eukprot:superscaffoldBa00009667_g24236